MKSIYITIIILLSSLASMAQNRTISGVVKDQESQPLANISVQLQGNNIAGKTDATGRFTLKNIPTDGKLIFSGIGYKNRIIDLTTSTTYQVVLDEDVSDIDEVVVVGFGKQKKATMTGAIASIGGTELKQSPVANMTNALSGRLPGLFSQQRSGQPGKDEAAIQIRGISTYRSGTGPLLIVDGVQQDNIGQIDMNEVENVSILKDASATAVFGIRGANGVIIVTTRRGNTGKAKVSVSNQTGVQVSTRLPKMLESYEALLLLKESYENDGQGGNFPYTEAEMEAYRTGSNPQVYPNVNWFEEMTRPYAIQNQFNTNVSGGTENVKYFVSAGYTNQNGIFKRFKESETDNTFYFKRYNFRSNIDIKPTKTLDIGIDLSTRLENVNQPRPYEGGSGNIFHHFYRPGFAPYSFSIYNPDGSFGAPAMTNTHPNLVAHAILGGYERSYNTVLTSNINVVQKLDFLIEGLAAKGSFAFNNTQYSEKRLYREGYPTYRYNPVNDTYSLWNPTYPVLRPYTQTTANLNPRGSTNLVVSLNYDHTFGQHHVGAMALYNQNSSIYVNAAGVPDASRRISYIGWVGRATYDFANKYLLEVNLGYTGSNQFNDQSRYGLFPAVSVGWTLSEEKWSKEHLSFLDFFKIRGSYGLVGNDNVGLDLTTYAYLSTYVPSGSYQFGDVNGNYNGLAEGKLGNDALTWEKEKKTNIGFDARFFNSKFSMTFDYFVNNRFDIITTRSTVGDIVGIVLPEVNLGKVENKGYEIELGYNGTAGQLGYFVRGNVSYAKNKILEMDEEQKRFPWLQRTGQSVGQPYGLTWTGFYQSQEELDNSPKTALKPEVGDLKYEDLNQDGVINDDDMAPIGFPQVPNTNFGLSAGVNYAGFDLSVLFQGARNVSIRPSGFLVYDNIGNFQEMHLGRWTPENAQHATYPKLHLASGGANNRNLLSTFWLHSGNYLRFKNLEVGYRFKPEFLKRIGVQDLRVYMNATNLATWDTFKLVDPESPNGSGENYPQQRIYSFGLNLNF